MSSLNLNESEVIRREGRCPGCGWKVNEKDFHNEEDKKEFRISGLCGSCQYAVFSLPED